jgi:hypothetical protein
LVKVSRAPQRETAFRSGELGELAVGAMQDKRAAKGSLVALHDRTKLLDGLDRQVSVVQDTLAAHGHADVPVHGVLCAGARAPETRRPPSSPRARLRSYRPSHPNVRFHA